MNRPQRLFCTWLCLLSLQAQALIPTDNRLRLTEHWEFIRQEMGSIWEVMRPIPGPGKPEAVPLWQPVTLPHCFNATDAVDPDANYYQGPGWYRTTLDICNPYPDGRTYLEFEGAGQQTEVYLYTTRVASHTGGYDEWKVDLTEAIEAFRADPICTTRYRGRIPIAIRCDNSRDTGMIPSDMSDFNLYGGLYRYVNLVYLPATHLEQIAIQAQTDEAGRQGDVEISLQASHGQPLPLQVRLLSPEGQEVGSATPTMTEGSASCHFTLRRPQLWSPDSPRLYTCLVEAVTGSDTLRATERFGFRHFHFAEHGPFFLNGKRLLLRGTHRHEDHAGVGAAMTEAMMRHEMQQIKAMGANFIRLGHYQQSDIILDLCDELGLLVWEEIPWCRGGLGGAEYQEQVLRMLTHMIEQHRNHPSILLWGLGNENDWPGDFPTFSQDSIRWMMGQLNDLAHRLDPTRLTTIRRCDFCRDVVDVYSPSIWAGWYSRRFRDYKAMTTKAIDAVPHFVHAEWGGDSHAGRHAEEVSLDGHSSFDIQAADRNGDWSESYIVRLFDWHLKEQETMPQLTGSLFWTFKDFSTPLRPDNPIPYVNQKGVVQRDGTPKESYYVFQSYWSREPMLHIYGHTWPVRWGAPDEPKEVLVYSNCPEVELLVNGVSQGRKRRDSQDFPAAGLHWQVTLREGENTIEAIGYQGKERLHDRIVQTYQTRRWGPPTSVRLTPMEGDVTGILLQAEVTDSRGVRCLDAKGFIEFGCTHPHALQQHQGTTTGSRRIQAANGLATIRLRRGFGRVAVSVHGTGLKGDVIVVDTE